MVVHIGVSVNLCPVIVGIFQPSKTGKSFAIISSVVEKSC